PAVPRLGLGEELLGGADRVLDEDLLALRRDVRRQADAAAAVVGLVAAVRVLGRRGEVRRDAVRVAAVERRPAGAAFLHRHPDLRERLTGTRRDHAVADSERVDPAL